MIEVTPLLTILEEVNLTRQDPKKKHW